MALGSTNDIRTFVRLSKMGGTDLAVATNPFFQQRILTEDVELQRTTTESQEIAADRFAGGSIVTGTQAGGDIGFEFSYGAQEYAGYGPTHTGTPMLSAGLQSPPLDPTDPAVWMRLPSLAAGSTVPSNTGLSIDITAAATLPSNPNEQFIYGNQGGFQIQGTGASRGLFVGGWCYLASTVLGNGECSFRVHSIIDDDTFLVDSCNLPTAGPYTGVTIERMGYIESGDTRYEFDMEVWHSKLDYLKTVRGMEVNTMALTHAVSAISTGSFGMFARDIEFSDAPQVTPGVPVNNPTDPSAALVSQNVQFNALGRAKIAVGRQLGLCATNSTITVNNNVAGIQCIGSDGFEEINSGTLNVTGSHEAYLSDNAAEYRRSIDNQVSSTANIFRDAINNTYVVEVPEYTYGDASISNPGANQTVPLSLSYSARAHPGYPAATISNTGPDFQFGLSRAICRIWYSTPITP